MSASEALRLARENGVRIVVSGFDLLLDAAREPASAVVEAVRRHKVELVALLAGGDDRWTAEDWQAYFEERAGVAQFDGKQSREQAEAIALECCIVEWLNRHPCRSDPSRCLACGQLDQAGHTVVPFGTENRGRAWLHSECWEDWHEERRKTARRALAQLGINAA